MTRNEFLNTIYLESGFMLPDDRRETLKYFRARFVAGIDEEAVCAELGDPKTALKRYIANEASFKRGLSSRILTYISAALASPAIIYGAAVIIIALIIITLAAMILLAALPFIGIELWLSGFDSFIRLMPQNAGFADRLCITGLGLFTSAAGIFIMLGVYKLYKRFIPWLFNEILSSYSRIKRKLRRHSK